MLFVGDGKVRDPLSNWMRGIGHLDTKSFVGPVAYVSAADQLQIGPIRRIETERVVEIKEGSAFSTKLTTACSCSETVRSGWFREADPAGCEAPAAAPAAHRAESRRRRTT